MKKVFYVLMACIALSFSCTKKEKPEEPPQEPIHENETEQTYSLTVSAVRAESFDTRALYIDDPVVKATWAIGEKVKVYKGVAQVGTLHGSKTSLDAVCDYATATVTVDEVSENTLTVRNAADFISHQAIVEFKCGGAIGSEDDDKGDIIFANQMCVIAGNTKNTAVRFSSSERKLACWYRPYARVEVCTHPGYDKIGCPYCED